MRTKKSLLSVLLALLMVCNLIVPTIADGVTGKPQLKVTADKTEIDVASGTANVIYTVTLNPNGNEIAAFQFTLAAPEGMTLSTNKLPNAIKNKGGDGYWLAISTLAEKEDEDTGEITGFFDTVDYTNNQFVASSGKSKLSAESVVMTMKVTVDISAAKAYKLGVTGFACYKDGSTELTVDSPIVDTITVKSSAPVDQTITASNVTATYGDTNAKINASTNGDGTLSYAVKSGEGEDVIEVNSSTGALTIKKAGTATVTITAAATSNYKEATKDVTVTVNPKKLNPDNNSTGPKQTLFITYVEENFIYDGTKKEPIVRVRLESYSSDKKLTENVDYTVTYDNNIDASGTPSNPANATFTVTAKQGSNYTWEPHKMDFVIKKATLTITAADVSAAIGDTNTKIDATTNVDGCTLTYAVTSGADVIDVDTNGNLTIKKAGSAQVTITAAINDNYETATKVVNVNIVQNPLAGDVTIFGDRLVGKTLTVDVSDLNEKTHLSYQWYRGDDKIDGANSNTYKLTKDDLGKKITVEVKTTAASNVAGSKTATTTDIISCEHTFTGNDTTVAPLVTAGTCKDNAVYRYYCVLCETVDPDTTHTFEGTKVPTNHVGGTEVRDQKAATCTEKGYTGDTYCLGCDTKTATGTDIPATGHNLTYTASVVATCNVEGHIEYWHCSKCDNFYADKDAKKVLSAEDVESAKDPTNHVGETEVKNKKDATCTENGYTGDTYCKSCDKVITKGSEIPALGHNFKYVDRPNQDGFIKYADLKCTNEGCTVSAKDVDAMKNEAVQATLNIDVFLQCAKAADSGNFTGSGVPFFYQVIKGENDNDIDKVGFPLFTGDFSHRLNQQYTLVSGKGTNDNDALFNMQLPQREGEAWTVKMVQPDSALTGWTVDDTEYKVYFDNDCTELVIKKKVEKQIEQDPTTGTGASTDPTEPTAPTDPVFEAVNEIVFNNTFKVEKKDDPTPPTPTPVIPDGPKHVNRRYPAKPAASTDTKKPDGVTSARTFDAGVALYVGMSVLSLTGTALVIGKKKEF